MKKFLTAILAATMLFTAGVFGDSFLPASAEEIAVADSNAQVLNGYKNFQTVTADENGWTYETTTITNPAISLKESQYIDLSDGQKFSISFTLPFYDQNKELITEDIHKQNVALIMTSIETGKRLYCYIYTVNFLNTGVTNGAIYMRDKGGDLWLADNFATKDVTYAADAQIGEEFSFTFDLTDFFSTIPSGSAQMTPICPVESEGNTRMQEFFAGTEHVSFMVALTDGGKNEEDARAKIIVTEYCGQSLKSTDGKLNITQAPALYELHTYKQAADGETYPAYAVDEPLMVALTGNYTYLDTPANFKKGSVTRIPEVYGYTQEVIGGIKEIVVRAYAPDGTTVVEVPNIGDWNYEFTPTQAGNWRIAVKSVGYGGESEEQSVTVTVKQIYKIVVDGTLAQTYKKGSVISIPTAYTVDENGQRTTDEVSVTVKNPFAITETLTDGKLTASVNGVYTVKYTAVNPDGETIEVELRFSVEEQTETSDKGGCAGDVGGATTALVLVSVLAVFACIIKNNKEKE